jgi:hypothetical protein
MIFYCNQLQKQIASIAHSFRLGLGMRPSYRIDDLEAIDSLGDDGGAE